LQESEASKILMALDGLAAYLETTRNLIVASIEPVQQSKATKILDMIPNDVCLHEDSLELVTLGGISRLCNSCGEQF
jgi:hypothetical protein